MNKLYIDQITRYMNSAKLEFQNYYDDQAMAIGAMRWIVAKLENELGNCHGVKDGKCQYYWKHDDCVRLMGLLFDLTGSDKYITKNTKTSSWD